VVRERRERYRFLLGDPKRRREGLDRLNHCRDLDERHATWLPSNADVVGMLRDAGAPEQAYVISATPAIDGRTMALADAVREAAMGGWGTLVSCLPGRLAFYYDELGERRAILRRPRD